MQSRFRGYAKLPQMADFNVESLAPYLGQLTFGGLAGFASGYALKKVGKLLAIALGLLFVSIQLLAYAGYLTVDWLRIQESVNPLLESEQLNQGWQALVAVLTNNFPFAAAFIPGLILGLRRG